MPKATVIIPNYNGIKYIKGCLDSLFSLEEQELFTVLVVDNASSDGSRELIQDEYPWVQLILMEENTGFCHAVNVGIRAASAPFVILLNNDTVVKAGFVKNLVDALEKDSRCFSVSALMLMWDRPDLVDDAGDRYCALGWAYSRGKGRPAAAYERPAEVFSACGGASVYKKSVFEEIGYFDENHFAYLEDLDIGYRARIYGYRNRYEPSACVLHAGSASSGSRYNEFKTRMSSANSVYVIGKNMPLLQWILNLPFLIPGFMVKTVFFFHKKMGMLYIRGLLQGFVLLFSKEGRARKVKFRFRHLGNYLAIQGQLYMNLFRYPGKK